VRLRALLVVTAAVAALPASGAAAKSNGLALYGRYCVTCHGPNGSGTDKGPSLRGVGARAADLYLSSGYMPLQRTGLQPKRTRPLLGRGQIKALTSYVASLGGPPVPRPHPARGSLSEGQHLFATHCAGCHQIVAEGGLVTGGVPPALGEATPVQVAEAVRVGPYLMPRFTPAQISDSELDSLVRYVEWTKRPDDRGGWSIGRIGPIPEGLVTWFLAMAVLVGVCTVVGKRLHG
jgi:ubiquinol-cytochrome c reductase cytochrome c subunit